MLGLQFYQDVKENIRGEIADGRSLYTRLQNDQDGYFFKEAHVGGRVRKYIITKKA